MTCGCSNYEMCLGREDCDRFSKCTLCDPRPEATDAECDKWPGHYKGCMIKEEGHPINGWNCDGRGNLTKVEFTK